jgi:hypothetical protein
MSFSTLLFLGERKPEMCPTRTGKITTKIRDKKKRG